MRDQGVTAASASRMMNLQIARMQKAEYSKEIPLSHHSWQSPCLRSALRAEQRLGSWCQQVSRGRWSSLPAAHALFDFASRYSSCHRTASAYGSQKAMLATWCTTGRLRWPGSMRSPVVLLLGGHPGGELGSVEGGVQALEGRLEADLERARVQVQGRPE